MLSRVQAVLLAGALLAESCSASIPSCSGSVDNAEPDIDCNNAPSISITNEMVDSTLSTSSLAGLNAYGNAILKFANNRAEAVVLTLNTRVAGDPGECCMQHADASTPTLAPIPVHITVRRAATCPRTWLASPC